jgi:hypothetical protein
MWVGGQRHTPAALSPRKTRYPLYRRLGGTQGGQDGCGKLASHWDSIPGSTLNNNNKQNQPYRELHTHYGKR